MRLLLAFVITVALAFAETTVTDTVYRLDGTTADGAVFISLSDACVAGNGFFYAKSTKTATITGGALSVELHPNDDCTPANTTYSVSFMLNDGQRWDETWNVPTSVSLVTIGAIRTSVTIPSSSLGISYLTGLTSKGDLISHNGIAPMRHAAGTNGYALVSDSSSPTGLAWAVTLTGASLDTEAELESLLGDVTNVFTNNDGALDDDDVTAADVGTASPSLDDTDASVEWEDANLDATGAVTAASTTAAGRWNLPLELKPTPGPTQLGS